MDNDAILQQAVIDELAADDNLETSTIGVSVKAGTVHLIGNVPTDADLQDAEAKVRNVPGVIAIVDDLKIK
jgi:osmotically-inducible protein OsmY